jgi:hypothetical protein
LSEEAFAYQGQAEKIEQEIKKRGKRWWSNKATRMHSEW